MYVRRPTHFICEEMQLYKTIIFKYHSQTLYRNGGIKIVAHIPRLHHVVFAFCCLTQTFLHFRALFNARYSQYVLLTSATKYQVTDTASARINVYAFYKTSNCCWNNQFRIAGVCLKILVNDFVEENDCVDLSK